MNKKIAVLSLLVTALSYSNDDFFYEEANKGVKLNESVISTTGFETSQRNVTNTVTVITAKDIEEKNYQSVSDALRDVPSVNIIGDPKDPIIDMRGQGSKATSNVQILIDGVSVNLLDTSHARTPINTVPVENIEKIEVIPGGGAILYGSGTRGGIVNIITKSGAGYTGGAISSEINTFGGKKAEVSYGATVDKFGINLNYTKNDYKGFRDGDESDSEFFEGSLKYKIDEKQNITLKYSRYEDDATSPRGLTKDKLSNPESNGLNTGDELIVNNTIKDEVTAKYEYNFTEKTQLDLVAFYQETDIYNENNYYKGVSVKNYMDYTDRKVGFKPKLKVSYGNDNNLILGYDYIKNNLTRDSQMDMFSSEQYANDLTKETHSVFILNRNPIGKFEFTQGIRYEYADYNTDRSYRKSGSSPTHTTIQRKTTMENMAYELVGNYLYSETGNVYVKAEKGFTSPTPSQLVDKLDGEYINNDLESETYVTYEFGFKDYVFSSFVSGAIYLTETKDEIATENLAKMDFINYNIGKTRRYGLELNAEQYFGKLTVREGYSLVKTEILKDQDKTIEGNEISNIPTNRVNVALDYLVNPKVNVILNTVYSSGYYLNNNNTDGKQNENIVSHLTLNYKPTESLRVYTGINNLFNEKYYNSISTDGKEYNPAAERSFYAGFKYNF
ncbi:MAG: TonB-dependent receptor family protein [Cetobacterium sp.]|uniref:TonB-dependent receptor family protein n=2 Tax=Cetobacterium sp. TaxID=2071632 RepID=UPI003F34D684